MLTIENHYYIPPEVCENIPAGQEMQSAEVIEPVNSLCLPDKYVSHLILI